MRGRLEKERTLEAIHELSREGGERPLERDALLLASFPQGLEKLGVGVALRKNDINTRPLACDNTERDVILFRGIPSDLDAIHRALDGRLSGKHPVQAKPAERQKSVWIEDIEAGRKTEAGIASQQIEKIGGAAAWQTNDENRLSPRRFVHAGKINATFEEFDPRSDGCPQSRISRTRQVATVDLPFVAMQEPDPIGQGKSGKIRRAAPFAGSGEK